MAADRPVPGHLQEVGETFIRMAMPIEHGEPVRQKISVVIPARYEAMNLPLVLDDVNRTIAQMPEHDVEVVVVDDKSSDRTGEVAAQRGASVIRNSGPSGKGCALRVGFQIATSDVIVMMDADYSHRAEDIPGLLGAMKDGVGMVIGSRIYGGSDESGGALNQRIVRPHRRRPWGRRSRQPATRTGRSKLNRHLLSR